MRKNDTLRIHVINIGHGDSILIEFPDEILSNDDDRRIRFGLVDAGGEDKEVETKTADYLRTFLEYRLNSAPSTDPDARDWTFEFICLTHPHQDHYYGMEEVLSHFCSDGMPLAMRPRQFWDCGFRYNTDRYLQLLELLSQHREVRFMRVTSGTEFHYNETEVLVLAPSIDMRNRYDTYGVDVNNGSIVLRLTLGESVAILSGDAKFDSWGKICEEYPRTTHIIYPEGTDDNPERRDPTTHEIAFLNQESQLDCHLLKVSHHGSVRGTSYEYVEKLSPTKYAISCDLNSEYAANWKHKFPHPVTRLVIGEESDIFKADEDTIPTVDALGAATATTSDKGTLVYKLTGSTHVTLKALGDHKHDRLTVQDFVDKL